MKDSNATKQFRVIIGCGGTGGHIYPGLVLADAIKSRVKDVEFLFVGAKGKMEMDIVPEYGYNIKGLNIRGFQRQSIFKNLLLPFQIIRSIWQSWRILKEFKPNFAIGTGGYASAPILFAAAMRGVPTLIHEQNAIAGLANKILGKYVSKICITYESANKFFPPKKTMITGTPIRKNMLSALDTNKRDACEFFGLDESKPCLLVFGGSLGTQSINECLLKNLSLFLERDLQLIWITGDRYFEKINSNLTAEHRRSIKIFPFLKEMHKAYAAADVIVSRGGATSIAELCLVKKPVIFVPSPNTTDDQQTKNIFPLVEAGAAIMVKDHQVELHLMERVMWLIRNKVKRGQMAEKFTNWSSGDASEMIVSEMINMVG